MGESTAAVFVDLFSAYLGFFLQVGRSEDHRRDVVVDKELPLHRTASQTLKVISN